MYNDQTSLKHLYIFNKTVVNTSITEKLKVTFINDFI